VAEAARSNTAKAAPWMAPCSPVGAAAIGATVIAMTGVTGTATGTMIETMIATGTMIETMIATGASVVENIESSGQSTALEIGG
jgi:hypothetical protein